jgi:hypothetical protein
MGSAKSAAPSVCARQLSVEAASAIISEPKMKPSCSAVMACAFVGGSRNSEAYPQAAVGTPPSAKPTATRQSR